MNEIEEYAKKHGIDPWFCDFIFRKAAESVAYDICYGELHHSHIIEWLEYKHKLGR